MATFITGTQTPNPRKTVILQYNKIPTKKAARKPSFFLASDQTETTSGKKAGFKKAQTLKIRTGAMKMNQNYKIKPIQKKGPDRTELALQSFTMAESIIDLAIDFVIKREREQQLMKMMENYVKQHAVIQSLAVIDMQLTVRDINQVLVESDEDVEPVAATVDTRCQIHIPHKVKEETIIDMFSNLNMGSGSYGQKLRKSFSLNQVRTRRITNIEKEKK